MVKKTESNDDWGELTGQICVGWDFEKNFGGWLAEGLGKMSQGSREVTVATDGYW
jgi:hypothetical protein